MVQHFPALNRPTAPICSVCIANYNGVGLLDDCLASVFAQVGGHCIEVIVHDDASMDGSIALLREKFPEAELLASEENVGFCVANNRMVEHARGSYVLLLNNDAALHPDAVTLLLEAARAKPAHGIYTLPQYDWQTGLLVDRGCLLDPFYNPVPNLDPRRQDVAYAIGACLFLPRTLWDELGGLPEWMGSIGEDLYLCCLARLRGHFVRALGESGYRHRQGQSFGGNRVVAGRLSTTYRRRCLSERNKTAVMVICTPTIWVWALLAVHLAMLSCEGIAISAIKRNPGIWRSIYAPIWRFAPEGFRALRRRRRDAQLLRRISGREWLSVFSWMPRKIVLLCRHGWPALR